MQAGVHDPTQLQPGQAGHLAAKHLLHRHAREEAGYQWEQLPGKGVTRARCEPGQGTGGMVCHALTESLHRAEKGRVYKLF